METFDRKNHWENIYQTKQPEEVSWYQPSPRISLDVMQQHAIPTTAHIIDVGGGDSLLVDHLLMLGYEHITVLDISEEALRRAQQRLGTEAKKVTWLQADAATFEPTQAYDFWHDRAAFHFLTDQKEIEHYLKAVHQSLSSNGIFLVATFSQQGPKKCSGIPIQQYSEKSITERFHFYFEKISCQTHDHFTPFNTLQNFIFCTFRKKQL